MFEVTEEELLSDISALKGQVILITGGGGGFGKAAGVVAAKHGAKVILADLQSALLEQAVKEIVAAGGICSTPPIPTDVTKPHALRAAFDHCLEQYGRVPDVVYANAGVALDDQFEEDGEEYKGSKPSPYPRPPLNITLAVNLSGVLNTGKIAKEYWSKHPRAEGGHKRKLVMSSSMAGMTGVPAAAMYATSKHAVVGHWQETCRQLEAEGHHADYECHVICPFFSDTKIVPVATKVILAGIPLVPVPLMVKAMLHVASKSYQGPGYAILVPDAGPPAFATHTEYDPLSAEWSQTMHARCAKTDGWERTSAVKRVWNDFAKTVFRLSPGALLLRSILALVVIGLTWTLAAKALQRLPIWATIALGIGLGSAQKLGKRR